MPYLYMFTVLSTDEQDSYMYQTVGHEAVSCYADAMQLPLFRRVISGAPLQQGSDYVAMDNDEVEDLYGLLSEVKVLQCDPFWKRHYFNFFISVLGINLYRILQSHCVFYYVDYFYFFILKAFLCVKKLVKIYMHEIS